MPRTTKLTTAAAMQDAPQPPAGMSAAGKSLWALLVASRASAEWTPGDRVLLEMYVNAAMDVERLTAQIAKCGEVVDGKLSPYVTLREKRERAMLTAASRLKLLPSNRYTNKRAGELTRHAKRANAAQATFDADGDDLLASGLPTKGRLQ